VQDAPSRLSVDTLTAEAAEQDLASLFVPIFFVETFNVLSYTGCNWFAELCCRLVVNQVMPWIKLLNENKSLHHCFSIEACICKPSPSLQPGADQSVN
jgi:hypothetical protein